MNRSGIKRKRDKNNSNNRNKKDTAKYAIDERTGLVVFANDIASECQEKGIDPISLTFRCVGKSRITGEKCNAKLTLCSAHECNTPNSYFAHRGNCRDHIECCDCAADYRTLEISRTLNRSVRNLDAGEFIRSFCVDNKKKKKEESGKINPSAKNNKEDDVEDGNDKVDLDEVQRFVKPSSITDLYEVLAMAVARSPETLTEAGERPESIIINSKTYEKYRSGDLSVAGPKLIVTSNKRVYSNAVFNIKNTVKDACWVLLDPFVDDTSGKRLYYVLCSEDKEEFNKKYIKVLRTNNNKVSIMLMIGIVEKIDYSDDSIILCRIRIKDGRGKQIVKLREKINIEDKDKIKI